MDTATVTLDVPATTRDGLRAQAAQLGIAGRGAMNKAQLAEAVSARLNASVLVAPTLNAYDEIMARNAARTAPVAHGPVVELADFPYVAHAPVEAPSGTRTVGHKGTGLLRTRHGRKDYPAGRRASGRKGGRK